MNELLIYAGTSLFSLVLFYFWFRRQGYTAEKLWLTQQITNSTDEAQQQYATALRRLGEQHTSRSTTLLVALLIIPTAFVIDYLWFYDIPIENRVSAGPNADSGAPDLATAIKQLEQKLADNPDDLEGQVLYGRTMMSVQNFPAAVAAYQKAHNLDPTNANILADLAEAIAFKNNTGSFLGEPETYLSQAIVLDPNNQKAMWLQGIVYYEKQQYEPAEAIWSELLTRVDNPNIRSSITQQINQARTALNKPLLTDAAEQTAPLVEYFIVIDADENFKAQPIPSNARLFVYAKEVNGPPMPIAAVPIAAPFSWPMSVTLSNKHNLNPARKLSDFEQIKLIAKLSLTGVATVADSDSSSDEIIAGKKTTNIKLTFNK